MANPILHCQFHIQFHIYARNVRVILNDYITGGTGIKAMILPLLHLQPMIINGFGEGIFLIPLNGSWMNFLKTICPDRMCVSQF